MSELPDLSLLASTPADTEGYSAPRTKDGLEDALRTRRRQIALTKNQPSYIEYKEQVPYEARGPDTTEYPTTPSLWEGEGSKRSWNKMWVEWTRAIHDRAGRPRIAKNPKRGRYPRSGLSDELERLFLSKGGPLASD